MWIAGHCGGRGNTRVAMTGPEMKVEICELLVNTEFTIWTTNQHIREWESKDGLRQAKEQEECNDSTSNITEYGNLCYLLTV